MKQSSEVICDNLDLWRKFKCCSVVDAAKMNPHNFVQLGKLKLQSDIELELCENNFSWTCCGSRQPFSEALVFDEVLVWYDTNLKCALIF